MGKRIRVQGMKQGEFAVDRPDFSCSKWDEWGLSKTDGETRTVFDARMKFKDPQFFDEVRAGLIDFGAGDTILVD